MRTLILGITGMLGHAVWLNLQGCHETFGSIRGSRNKLAEKCPLFKKNDRHIISGVNVLNDNDLKAALDVAKPEVIVNCAGVVKQLPDARQPIPSISLNALFPHRLAKICAEGYIRLIHISTDCVFSGNKGNYSESDIPDAYDLYGRTKYLGEVSGNGCFTLRTSVVGRQLSGSNSLFEWVLSQKGKVRGFRKAIFSGLTNYAFAGIIRSVIEGYSAMNGLYHVSSEAITKYELLNRLKNALNLDIEIIPDDNVAVDRSLDSTKFRELTGVHIPLWDEMLEEFLRRMPDYEKWRY